MGGLIVPYLGFIIPTMGTDKRETEWDAGAPSGVADALFSKTRQRVLAILFGNAEGSLHANAIIRLADAGTGGVQRELEALEHSGLLRAKRVGNQKHYQANRDAPVFAALRELVLKTSGLADLLRAALTPMAERIQEHSSLAPSRRERIIRRATSTSSSSATTSRMRSCSLLLMIAPSGWAGPSTPRSTRATSFAGVFARKTLSWPAYSSSRSFWIVGNARDIGA